MKLYRFNNNLIDLEMISRIFSCCSLDGVDLRTGESTYGNAVLVRVEFILGAPAIDICLHRGSGLSGDVELDRPKVEYIHNEVMKLEAAWADCERVISVWQ